MRRIDYPLEENNDYYVVIPDRWLGSHYLNYLEATEAANGAKGVIKRFAMSIAICDDYKLPGLDGKPERWDLSKCDLQLMAWVASVVIVDFEACFIFPKKKLQDTGELLKMMNMAGTSVRAS